MRTLKAIASAAALGMALVVMALTTGCHSPDRETKSAPPWNNQRPWEHGIPGMTDRR